MTPAPLRGAAGDVHGRDLPHPAGPGVAVRWIEATGPALVLGSRQRDGVDAAACARDGVELCRRRSGGGAVWLAPAAHLWVEFLVAPSDPRWDDDVARACGWVGDAWATALAEEGLVRGGGLGVHRGPLERDAGVCFAAMGPGEVSLEGAKLVGIAQRRTREGARFQCVVHARWDAAPYARYAPGLGAVPGAVATIPALADTDAAAALVARLEEVVAR